MPGKVDFTQFMVGKHPIVSTGLSCLIAVMREHQVPRSPKSVAAPLLPPKSSRTTIEINFLEGVAETIQIQRQPINPDMQVGCFHLKPNCQQELDVQFALDAKKIFAARLRSQPI